MPRILTAPGGRFHSILESPWARRLALQVDEAPDLDALLAALPRGGPDLVLAAADDGDAALGACRRVRAEPGLSGVPLLLVVPHALAGGDAARALQAAGCQAVLARRAMDDRLLEEITRLLDLPRRVSRRVPVGLRAELVRLGAPRDPVTDRRRFLRLAATRSRPAASAAARISDLSETGAGVRMDKDAELRSGEQVEISLRLGGERVAVTARVIWTRRSREEGLTAGVHFREPAERVRRVIAGLLLWEVDRLADGFRLRCRDDIVAGPSYEHLLRVLEGHVRVDLARARYLDPAAVPAWTRFLAQLKGKATLSLVHCSISFLAAAARDPGILGEGRVCSLCLRTACERCSWEEELVVGPHHLDTIARPPGGPFTCPRCRAPARTDEIPREVRELLAAHEDP